jgi:hypothetical protein
MITACGRVFQNQGEHEMSQVEIMLDNSGNTILYGNVEHLGVVYGVAVVLGTQKGYVTQRSEGDYDPGSVLSWWGPGERFVCPEDAIRSYSRAKAK